MKFITSDYNSETGSSTVVVKHLGVIFVGWADLHPEDKPYGSMYTGCTIAEIRATIKALRYELKLAEDEARYCKSLVNSCTSCKNFNKYSKSSKVLFRQYNRRVKRVQDIKDEIKDLKEQLNTIIEARNKYIEKKKAIAKEAAKEVNVL